MAPLIIGLLRNTDLSAPILMAITMPVAILLMIGLLQPAKGGIIALQWWLGMHGFDIERPPMTELCAESQLDDDHDISYNIKG